MKKDIRNYLIGFVFFICMLCINNIDADAASTSVNELLVKYINCVNKRDGGKYIELFTNENRAVMYKSFIKSPYTFFDNSEVMLERYRTLSKDVGDKVISLSEEEQKNYSTYQIVYTQILKKNLETQLSEYKFYCFLFVIEDEEWKIARVSVPHIDYIVELNNGFSTAAEEQQRVLQIEKIQAMKFETSSTWSVTRNSNSTLVAPRSIRVYFTKDYNETYHGAATATIDFTTYLKNVIPSEWVVSHYGNYPSYLQAGAMASKMYAWYYTVHPKYDYAPYYADLRDDNASQHYDYYAYSNLTSRYKTYLDNALAYCNGLALVRETSGALFDIQYRTNEGTMHSGYLNQAGAYELAQNGYGALQILQYYLGSTAFTMGENVVYVIHS